MLNLSCFTQCQRRPKKASATNTPAQNSVAPAPHSERPRKPEPVHPLSAEEVLNTKIAKDAKAKNRQAGSLRGIEDPGEERSTGAGPPSGRRRPQVTCQPRGQSRERGAPHPLFFAHRECGASRSQGAGGESQAEYMSVPERASNQRCAGHWLVGIKKQESDKMLPCRREAVFFRFLSLLRIPRWPQAYRRFEEG